MPDTVLDEVNIEINKILFPALQEVMILEEKKAKIQTLWRRMHRRL